MPWRLPLMGRQVDIQEGGPLPVAHRGLMTMQGQTQWYVNAPRLGKVVITGVCGKVN